MTISLCMIVKNEEDTLERCLNSALDIAEEIIIADTGSTDKTKEIAERLGAKVYDFPWIDDFSAARNFAFSKANMDYILWLDADDILLPEDAEKLLRLKSELEPEVDIVMMRYNTGFDEAGRVTFSYYRERLVKREKGFLWREPVHEYLEIGGKVINADIAVTHAKAHPREGSRNVAIYERILREGGELSPRGTYYYARELKDNARFAEAIGMFRKFLEDGKGWVEDNIAACGELARCYQEQNQGDEALAALFQSLRYDTPRAEICCELGYHFKARERYKQAAFWFSLALWLEKPQNEWGFRQEDCWGYIPCIECAVCYDRLGQHDLAEAFNNRAEIYKPGSPSVQHNKTYFENRKKALVKAEQAEE